MTAKEIGELRRRFKPDKNNITNVRGCYVNDQKQIISRFDEPMVVMSQLESEALHDLLKKTLSGRQGRNLLDISFDTAQVVSSDEHRLLMALRDSRLKDDAAVEELFTRISQVLDLQSSYMILLTCDSYDVPFLSANDEEMEDASTTIYSYILCTICPVKLVKSALSYYTSENRFYSTDADGILSAPELGFLFPAFDDRAANLYGALYYTKDSKENHPELADVLFKQELPLPAAVQKTTFEGILGETLADDCRMEVVQAVQEHLCDMITEHKESGSEEPLVVTRSALAQVLTDQGVSDSRVEAFRERYNEEFGYNAALPPANMVDTRQTKICTPDVTIQVNPERGDLIQTRVIDGTRYILIRAEEGVEVNGVNIRI